jgi:phage terminase large subunit-like protein
MMRAGTKGRRQALIFMITNSGHDKTSVCYDYHEYGRKVSAGSIEDDSFFAFICSLDEGDDPFKDESCWKKANPSLGHTFEESYLREQVTQARGCLRKRVLSGVSTSVSGLTRLTRG